MLAISTLPTNSLEEYLSFFREKNIGYFEIMDSHVSQIPWPYPYKISNLAQEIPSKSLESKSLKSFPSLVSEKLQERQKAIDKLMDLVKEAQRIKTPYIVIWPGYIEWEKVPWAPESISKFMEQRSQKALPFIDRLCRSLFEVWKKEPNIVFCIPPAKDYSEIPLFQELEWIQEDLSKVNIQYWHNTAHCYLQEKKGLQNAEAWLAKYGSTLAGIHLEDVVEERTLYPPGIGEIDFRILKSYLSRQIRCVIRAENRFSPSEIWTAYQYIKEIL